MNPRLTRSLDAGIGRIVCLLLTWHYRLTAAKDEAPPPPRKILFIKLVEPGASVLAMPAFNRAADLVGRDQVYICTAEENREIIDVLAPCPESNIMTLRNKNIFLFIIDLISVLRKARQLEIDAVVDLELFSRASAIISYLIGAKRRVGLHRFTMEAPYRGNLLTHKVTYNLYLHATASYLMLLACLSHSASDQPINKMPAPALPTEHYQFAPTTVDCAEVNALLSAHCSGELPQGPRILLDPNFNDLVPLSKWPTPHFLELTRQLLAAYPDALLIITGNEDQRENSELLCAAINSPRLISLAGATSLRQLLTLFALSDASVTSDSGTRHFASLTAITNIVMFGPELSLISGPLSGNVRPISAQLACSPCVNAFNHRQSPCNNNRCMQGIAVATVLGEISQSLAQRLPRLAQPA